MMTPEQVAKWAEERVVMHGPFSIPEEKYMLIIDLIEKHMYHIVAIDIKEACRRRVGL